MNEARLNEYPSQYDALRQQLNAQRPPPTVNYALRLSDEDVERIAAAVARGRPSWRKFWRGFAALLDFGPYRPL